MKLYKNIDGKNIELNIQEYEEYNIKTNKNKELSLLNYKNCKLNDLKKEFEDKFYLEYPLYKQNNIAIFGTEEEKKKFKKFYDEIIKEYEARKEKINNLTTFD